MSLPVEVVGKESAGWVAVSHRPACLIYEFDASARSPKVSTIVAGLNTRAANRVAERR